MESAQAKQATIEPAGRLLEIQDRESVCVAARYAFACRTPDQVLRERADLTLEL